MLQEVTVARLQSNDDHVEAIRFLAIAGYDDCVVPTVRRAETVGTGYARFIRRVLLFID